MNVNELATQAITIVIGTLPALGVVMSPILYNLKKVKDTAATMPNAVDASKEELTKVFAESSSQLTTLFQENTKAMATSLDQTKVELNDTLKATTEEITQKVNGSLESMQEELKTYKEELKASKEQQNLLAKENKAFSMVIVDMVGKDPKLVQSGVAKIVADRMSELKMRTTVDNTILKEDVLRLKSALVQAKTLMSKEEYQQLLTSVDNAKPL